MRSAETGSTEKEYDEAGNLRRLADARGVTSQLTFDALNRLTRVVHRADSGSEAVLLAKRIRDSGLWKPGMFVRLVSCNVGAGGKQSLVWKLAQELGAPVSGPDTQIVDFPRERFWYPSNSVLPDGMVGPSHLA